MTGQMRLTLLGAVATLLASLSLSAVFDDGAWFWPVVAAVGASAAGCALGRRLGLPRLLVPVVGLVALACVVTWLYARDVAVFGFLPGPEALRTLGRTVGDAFEDIRRFSSPAPPTEPLVLLASGGAGLVALMVDTLTVGYRSAALAGAPLLAMYAVPVGVAKQGVPWLLFVVGALGWLALMLAEGRDRLSRWGRTLDRRSTKGDNVFVRGPAEPLGVVGRRIGAAAVGLALLVPALLPWDGVDLFTGRGGGGGGSNSGGAAAIGSVNPLVRIGADLDATEAVQLLSYTTTDLHPDYLTMVVLDTYSQKDHTWVPAAHHPDNDQSVVDFTPESGTVPGTPVTTKVTIEGLKQAWLPILKPTDSITGISARWGYSSSQEIYTRTNQSTLGQTYTVESKHPVLTSSELRNVAPPEAEATTGAPAFTQLPSGIPRQVTALANAIVAGLSTDYDKALALQNYFLDDANGFTYNTKLPTAAPNSDPLVNFLTNKTGFCQQFASAYAVLARAAGLPTRVVVGFTPGTLQKTSPGVYQVDSHNAHAWPEVFFSGYGWIRFEPTKGAPTGVTSPSWTVARTQGGTGDDTTVAPAPTRQVTQAERNAQRALEDIGDALSTTSDSASSGPTGFPWKRTLVAVLVLLALLPGAARLLRRRRRFSGSAGTDPATAVTAAWTEVADTARDLRLPWSSARTPRGTAAWLRSLHVDAAGSAAADALAGMVERSRYAPRGSDVLRGDDPARQARQVVRSLEAAAPGRERWQARLLPASVMAAAGDQSDRVLDAVDRTLARARDWLVRPLVRRGSTRSTS
jgi:transglutaminase-like putative cysteine protease